MVDITGKIFFVDTIKTALSEVAKKLVTKLFSSQDEKVKLAKAITAIKRAIIETKDFIEKEGYKPNRELSSLWHDALNASVEAGLGNGLPDYLYHKADFWGAPQDWLNNPETLKLVPKLKELRNECDSLMVKLNN